MSDASSAESTPLPLASQALIANSVAVVKLPDSFMNRGERYGEPGVSTL